MQTRKNFGAGRYRFLGLFFTQVFTQAKPQIRPPLPSPERRAVAYRATLVPPRYRQLP